MALLRATLSAVFALMVIAAAANAASISHGHVHEMQKQKHGRTTVAVRRALGARVLRARAAVGFTPEEGISTGESMYFYPRPDVCFNKPSRTQQRGELPLDNVCAAVVDILAAAASNVNAMAGVAITDNGYVVVALSGAVGNPAKTFDDNDLQWMADEMKKVEPLMKLFGSFDQSHIINLNAPNAQWHHLSQLLTAVGTEIGVPGGNHAADSACPNDRLGHTAYRAFPGANLPRTEVVWSNGGGNGAGDRLARVYAHNGGVNVANPYGACAGTKLIAFEALSGLTYKCMAERKTQQRGYRASCLTCQEVIPQLRGGATHRQVERFKANLKAACTGIDQVPLLTATNDEQNALAALQQAKLQRTQLEADVTLRTQAYDLMMSTVQQVVGMEPNLDKRQKLIKAQYEQAVAALRDDQQVKRIPELENAHRVAAVRLQIITLHGALQAQALAAECDLRIKNARAFALY